MTERRKFTASDDRRGKAGKVFQTAEQILKYKTEAADKLRGYEADAGVRVSSTSTFILVVVCVIIAMIGIFTESLKLLLAGILGCIVIAIVGIWLMRIAKEKAVKKFKKDNLHLVRYLPS